MNSIEFADRIANMWKDSRAQAGKSQEYVAKALGVSKKTVQNWEAGTATPSFRMALEWFEALGVPMYPHIMSVLYPKEMEGLSQDSSMEDIKEALKAHIDELDDFHVRELLFILYGSHGSSPTGAIDLLTTYLHLPMAIRVCLAENMVSHYEVVQAIGLLKNEDHVLPKISTLRKCVNSAKSAVLSGKETYTITEAEE